MWYILNMKLLKVPALYTILGITLSLVIIFYLLVNIISTDEENTFALRGCNVAGISLQGDLVTYATNGSGVGPESFSSSEDITYLLELAEETPNIKAILLEIDSYGGSPVAAAEIVDTVKKFMTKPVIVQIREAGLSGAYWVASTADYIIASELSDIGGIGVTQSYVDEDKYNKREGFTYNSLSRGEFKDMLDPQKALTYKEKLLLQRDLDIVYEVFVAEVANSRNLSSEKVLELADGSSMLGDLALEKGLIDEVGGYYEVIDYITSKINGEAIVCW
ncbi:hypothetical protein COB80_00300 [Candidatus Kaiserbacteria bacterium]|nr:MAG: hypothetical protein COB80_00300 [Candidatus Kaiserbacteria bacterium]